MKIQPHIDRDMPPNSRREKLAQERKERTRQRLLGAATKIFAASGYHKTLVSDVVAEAGMGQGTFYRYFKDKRSVFETLLDGFFQMLFNEFSDMSTHLPASVAEYREASLSAISRAARVVERNRELCLLFLREAHSVDSEISNVVSGAYDRFAMLAGFYLEHAIAKGYARPCNVDMVSRAIVGIGIRTVEDWLNKRYAGIPVPQIVRELVDFAFLGLGARNAGGKREHAGLHTGEHT